METSPSLFSHIGAIFDSAGRRGATLPAVVAEAPLVGARFDASSSATQSPYDGGNLVNPLSGLGTVNDKGSAARPNLYRMPLSDPELEVLYRFTARRLINIVPDDCTRRGWQVEVPDVIGNPFEDAETRLNIVARFRLAHIWERVFGGSRIWLVVQEKGSPDLTTPLDPSKVTRVSNLIVLTRDEYSPVSYSRDPEDPSFGHPEIYSVSPIGTTSTLVHHTRLLTFKGAELTTRARRARRGDGESLLEAWWDALRGDNQIGAAGAHLAQELSVFWIQMKNRAASSTGGQSTSLLARMAALNISKSIANAVLLAEGEEIGEIARSTSGFKDLSEDAKRRLAMVTGYPEAILYGEAPSGLNTDGESHRTIWSQLIAAEHKRCYTDPLTFLYEILWYAEHGGPAEHWSLVYRPLDELTQVAQAALEKTHAETDEIRLRGGVITADEARSRWSDSGYQTSLTVDPDEPAPGLPDPPAAPMIEGPTDTDEDTDEESDEDIVDAEVLEDETEEEKEDRRDGVAHRISASQRRRMVKIPRAAQQAASKVLRWKKAHGLKVRGLSSPRVMDRCRQLARGGKFTVQDLIDINSWHGRSSHNTHLKPQFAGAPWRDAGYVAGQANGGEHMARFAAREVARYAARSDRTDAFLAKRRDIHPTSMLLAVPLPDRVGYAAMQQMVRTVLPDLVLDDWGHITVLYLGRIEADKVAEVLAAAKETIAEFIAEWDGSCQVEAQRVGHFSDADTGSPSAPLPIVIDYYAYGLRALQDRLTRRLAHLITVAQFPVYRPHATLGFLPRALTGEEASAVLGLLCPGEPQPPGYPLLDWTPETMDLLRGEDPLATFNLISARLDGEA